MYSCFSQGEVFYLNLKSDKIFIIILLKKDILILALTKSTKLNYHFMLWAFLVHFSIDISIYLQLIKINKSNKFLISYNFCHIY